MPQTVTFSVGAKVDKGSEVKSEIKFDAPAVIPYVDEIVCKLKERVIYVEAGSRDRIDLVVISADKYNAEKSVCPTDMMMEPCDVKKISYCFSLGEACVDAKGEKECKDTYYDLTRPHVFVGPAVDTIIPKDFFSLKVRNGLPEDVKISVLVVKKKMCPPKP